MTVKVPPPPPPQQAIFDENGVMSVAWQQFFFNLWKRAGNGDSTVFNDVAQRSKINDPTGGGTVDTEARAAINSIIDALEAFGFTANS